MLVSLLPGVHTQKGSQIMKLISFEGLRGSPGGDHPLYMYIHIIYICIAIPLVAIPLVTIPLVGPAAEGAALNILGSRNWSPVRNEPEPKHKTIATIRRLCEQIITANLYFR